MDSFIKQTIYSLKKEYGLPITIYKIISSLPDVDSGIISKTISFRRIRRAIVLPRALSREIFQVEYDSNSRLMFIDFDDVKNFEVKINDYIVFRNKKYLVNQVTTYDLDAALVLYLTESLGSDVNDYFETESIMNLIQEVSCTL